MTLLVELADLFDTSVDVLLGYHVKSNKQADTAARLRECLQNRDTDGLAEAEKALLRYPNCFDIVYQSANLYYLFGLMSGEKPLLRRSIELMERAILLLGQNTDPKISEFSITYDMAGAYSELGEEEKAPELLRSEPGALSLRVLAVLTAGIILLIIPIKGLQYWVQPQFMKKSLS